MSEAAYNFEGLPLPPPPIGRGTKPDRQPKGSRHPGRAVPILLAVVLIAAAGFFIAEGRSASDDAVPIRAETERVIASSGDVNARAARSDAAAASIDEALNAVSPAIEKADSSREAQIATQRAAVDAADAAIDQMNNGDLEGGLTAFSTTVATAVDANAAALATLRTDLDAVALAVGSLDEARQAQP